MTNKEFTAWPEDACAQYERHGYWQAQSLGDCLRQWANAHGDATALVERDMRLSYRQLDARVDDLAAGFEQLGIGRADRVLLQLPNSIAFVLASFALFRLGALPIMAMPAQRRTDIEALCALAEPVAYIVRDRFLGFDYAALAREVAAARPSLAHLIIDGADAGAAAAGTTLAQIEQRGAARTSPPLRRAPGHRETALLLLSGGTTGTPKLIPRTHADYAYNARASAQLCGLDSTSVYLAALPVAHNFPLACPGVLGTLSVGGTVVLAQTPGPDECFPLIARERVTFTALVPPLVQLWLEARAWDRADLSSLAFMQVGGARCESVLAAKVAPGFGCRLQQVFGMAEGLLCYTRLDDPQDVVLHTQGRPLSPHDEVRIVDADGRDVAPGACGELLTRGPYTLRGYYRADEHNARTFTADGYYRSGDLVRMTVQGNLVVEGRVKEQINRAGEKIATEEVEQALCFHPDITSAALVGLPDERLGERSCAFLIVAGREPGLGELAAFLQQHGLPQYKCPDQLAFIQAWPLTPVGKIDKRRLAALAARPAAGAAAVAVYAERELVTGAEPMALAALLVQAGLADDYALYEHHGEWSVGLGRAASVRADAAGVRLEQGGQVRDWPGQDLCQGVAQALAALPVRGWRVYGSANFELADTLHGSAPAAATAPLLDLFVPQMEVRLRSGTALLRALDPAQLERLAGLLAGLERDCLQRPRDDAAAAARPRLAPDIATFEADQYRRQVAQAVAEIGAGQYQKVILSRKVPVHGAIDLIASYLVGRRHNTPARSFVLQRPGQAIVGFSPETVVEVSAAGEVSTQPLAGTRANVGSEQERGRLRRELESDSKEIAEHAVSVKLAVQELEPLCRPGSVMVSEFMTVRQRGPVQHLASRVRGRLDDGRNAWHAFHALFPAVTASGIPKRQAIDAINRLETYRRGPYSGCVLIADSDGFLDAALVLRALYRQGDQTWLQAGAGIVAQSTPERELQETIEKFRSISQYLVVAQ